MLEHTQISEQRAYPLVRLPRDAWRHPPQLPGPSGSRRSTAVRAQRRPQAASAVRADLDGQNALARWAHQQASPTPTPRISLRSGRSSQRSSRNAGVSRTHPATAEGLQAGGELGGGSVRRMDVPTQKRPRSTWSGPPSAIEDRTVCGCPRAEASRWSRGWCDHLDTA